MFKSANKRKKDFIFFTANGRDFVVRSDYRMYMRGVAEENDDFMVQGEYYRMYTRGVVEENDDFMIQGQYYRLYARGVADEIMTEERFSWQK